MTRGMDHWALHREISAAGGSVSSFPRSVSTFKEQVSKSETLQHALYVHKFQVNTISWDPKMEGMTNDSIHVKDPGSSETPLALRVIQAKYCLLPNRLHPLIAIATVGGVMIYETHPKTELLVWHPVAKTDDHPDFHYTKGIAAIDHYVCVGASDGSIIIFSCRDAGIKVKGALREHKAPVLDLDFDGQELLVSGHSDGVILVWTRAESAIKNTGKISTGHAVSLVSAFKGFAICATVTGDLLFFNSKDGRLAAEVSAHCRPITSMDISSEGLLLTASEDSFLRVWRLRQSQANESTELEVSQEWWDNLENGCLIGGVWLDDVAVSGRRPFIIASFDAPSLFFYKAKGDRSKSAK